MTTDSICRHHYIVATPTGPTSIGVCKLCGAEREFKNGDQYGFKPWVSDSKKRRKPTKMASDEYKEEDDE